MIVEFTKSIDNEGREGITFQDKELDIIDVSR
jgi:hypothetical protein